MCHCDDAIVRHLEQDFKKTLHQQTPLEQWAAWLEQVVNDALAPFASSPDFPDRARQFLMKWSFYRYALARSCQYRPGDTVATNLENVEKSGNLIV